MNPGGYWGVPSNKGKKGGVSPPDDNPSSTIPAETSGDMRITEVMRVIDVLGPHFSV